MSENSSTRYHHLAETLRAAAVATPTGQTHEVLLKVAEDYDKMARVIETKIRTAKNKSSG